MKFFVLRPYVTYFQQQKIQEGVQQNKITESTHTFKFLPFEYKLKTTLMATHAK